MSNLTKSACSLSIQHLFRESTWCYLWTFTFPDDVLPEEAARRWRLFVRWLVETERVCVRVLESGSQNGRWHYHCVTPDRWDVNEVREAAERYDFGRINVKRIPAASARYVAKYLNKDSRGKLPKGQRRWACVGFDGVPVNRVEAYTITKDLPKHWAGTPYTHVEWAVEGYEPIRTEIRVPDRPDAVEVQRLHISAAEWNFLVEYMLAGNFVIVGEYRGLTINRKIAEDEKTNTRIETAFVEHRITSSGNSQVVREWLPAGANVETIELPAKLGAVVKATLQSVRSHKGSLYLTGVVTPLMSVAESPNQSPQVA